MVIVGTIGSFAAKILLTQANAAGGYNFTSVEDGYKIKQDWTHSLISSDGQKLIVAGNSRFSYISNNGGATWAERQGTGGNDGIWASLAGSSDVTKLIAGTIDGYSHGGLYLSNDSGVTWTPQTSLGDGNWDASASSADGQKLYAAKIDPTSPYAGHLYSTSDRGATWTEITTIPDTNISSIAVSSDGTKLAVVTSTSGSHVYTSDNSGATWTEQLGSPAPGAWPSIAMSSDGTKIIAATQAAAYPFDAPVYTSTDSGVTWSQQTSLTSAQWRSVSISDNGLTMAAGAGNGHFYTTTDAGTTWTQKPDTGISQWDSSNITPSGSIIVGYNGSVFDAPAGPYVSTDSGTTWTQGSITGARAWTTLAASADGTKLFATESPGYLYSSTDSGATWTRGSTSFGSWQGLIASADASKLVSIDSGHVSISTDSGATWNIDYDFSTGLGAIAISSDGSTIAAVDSNGNTHISHDAGASWSQVTGTTFDAYAKIALSSDGSKVVVTGSDFYGVQISNDGGTTWHTETNHIGTTAYSMSMSADGQHIIVVGYSFATIYTSNDGGLTWNNRPTNNYENGTPGPVALSSDGSRIILAQASGQQGSSCGCILTSVDNGQTWSKDQSAGFVSWYGVSMSSDGSKAHAAGSVSGVLNATFAVSAPAAPSNFAVTAYHQDSASFSWSAGDNGGEVITDYKLEYSSDGGSTWTNYAHTASTTNSATVTGLVNNTSYIFRLSMINAQGAGATVSLSHSTPDYTVPSSIANLSVQLVGATDASLSWSAPSDDGGHPVTDYIVEYNKNNTGWTTFSHAPQTSTTIDVTGLEPATDYVFRISAVNISGTGPSSVSSTYTTASPGAPDGPVDVTASTSGNSTIIVGWAPGKDNGSAIVHYEVQYRIYDATQWTTASSLIAASANSYAVQNLDAGTTYVFRVRAINGIGDGIWTQSVMTAHNVPFLYNGYTYGHVAVMNDDKLVAVSQDGIYLSTDRGATWHLISGPIGTSISNVSSIYSTPDGNKMVIATGPGYLYTSSDSGHTWVQNTAAGQDYWLGAVISDDGQTIYGTSYYDGIGMHVSRDFGITWATVATNNSSANIYYNGQPALASDNTLYSSYMNYSTYAGVIRKSTDNGLTWVAIDSEPSTYITSISVGGPHDMTIVASVESFFGAMTGSIVSEDGGATWSPLIQSDTDRLTSFRVTRSGDIYYQTNAAQISSLSLISATLPPATGVSVTNTGTTGSMGSTGTTKLVAKSNTTDTVSDTTTIQSRPLMVDGQTFVNGQTISKHPTFSGYTTQGVQVTVTVHSDPKTCTATADDNGYWECSLSSDLPAGDHTVAVAIAKADGTSEQLGPYSVSVANDTTHTTTSPTPQKESETSAIAESFPMWIIVAIIGGALAIAAIIISFVRKRATK